MRIVPPTPDHELRQLWMGRRAIGASSAELILKGSVRYGRRVETLHAKWEYITNRKDADPQTEAMLLGLEQEPLIRARWQEYIRAQGEPLDIIDDEHDFLVAQIDWLSYEGDRAADFKHTTSDWVWENVQKITRASNLLSEGTKMDGWFISAQHQLMILGLPQIDYYVRWQDFDAAHLIVKRDEPFIARMRAAEVAFWNECVIADKPPQSKKVKMVMD